MKKDEIKIGHTYTAKVGDRIVTVRIDSTNSHGGWNATNTATGKRIRIKSAQRLREAVDAGAETVDQKPNPCKSVGDAKPEHLSALDSAAQVLARAGRPMRVQELIAAMAEQGLWTSPAGKTPEATLYAAIIREIASRGDLARFRKTDRGLFEYATG